MEDAGQIQLVDTRKLDRGTRIYPVRVVYSTKSSGDKKVRMCVRGDLMAESRDTSAAVVNKTTL
jgi:hypothetical protein